MIPIELILIILMPFVGTLIGASSAVFMGERVAARFQSTLLGFASGVMVAAAVWSLLIPAIDEAEAAGGVAWLPATVGFLAGVGFKKTLPRYSGLTVS